VPQRYQQGCGEFNRNELRRRGSLEFAPFILGKRRNRIAVEILYLRFPRVEATLGFWVVTASRYKRMCDSTKKSYSLTMFLFPSIKMAPTVSMWSLIY
jgi:hypothetical protein